MFLKKISLRYFDLQSWHHWFAAVTTEEHIFGTRDYKMNKKRVELLYTITISSLPLGADVVKNFHHCGETRLSVGHFGSLRAGPTSLFLQTSQNISLNYSDKRFVAVIKHHRNKRLQQNLGQVLGLS
jgi:hypothetical protein